ncbi:hypothetical protein ACFL0O_00020 [Thermodesulfobacteriota bacterium]
MKFLSFKIFILCVFLPPVLYVFSVLSIEKHLNKKYTSEIEDIYTGDTRPLFDGSTRLKDAVNKNIDNYLQSKVLILWGVKADVYVTTKRGTILYPAVFDEAESSLLQPDPMKVAANNYNLMNEGLLTNVKVVLEHNTLLSNIILAFYICVSVLVLYFYYRMGMRKTKQEDMEKRSEISRLLKLEKKQQKKFKALAREREKLTGEIRYIKKRLEKEKRKAIRNEEEMINEIIALEEKINKNIDLEKEKQAEIDELKEQMKHFEKKKNKETKQKVKASAIIQKRFKTLYKNVSVNKRAISGFMELGDDMKIKSEEVIHRLNENSSVVPIKRKVFGKKSKETVQEVIFSYKGRLYFRKVKDSKIEVLAIGTKNTQVRDLEFLDNL